VSLNRIFEHGLRFDSSHDHGGFSSSTSSRMSLARRLLSRTTRGSTGHTTTSVTSSEPSEEGKRYDSCVTRRGQESIDDARYRLVL
jgi:hypothetical protein